jgi:predicted O-methyltransferase YrrM
MAEQQLWTSVDNYFEKAFGLDDDAQLTDALRLQHEAGLPAINVSPLAGKLLQMLVQSAGATRVLEIGTLGGYSTICIARAVGSNGRVVTLELDQKHADVARTNLTNAGVSHVVEIMVGRASDSLAALQARNEAPFDFVFIDADKESNAEYFEAALALTRPGSLIVVDNTVRAGNVIDATHEDSRVHGVRRFVERVKREQSVEATTIQTVGCKGYDGFTLIRRRTPN